MPQAAFDCVVRGGRVATAVDDFLADVGITDGTIAAIGRNLGAGTAEIDATGALVLPGGHRCACPHRAALGGRHRQFGHL